ncbi:tetratricopeptide repeat protein, partial [Sphaerotilus uruguayifluvii]
MPRHHVFLSYARKDNLPPPVGEADPPGWITGFATAMRDRYRRLTGRELRIFIDEQAIDDSRDWRRELGAGLREAQLLIAFVSPHYLASPHCRWEWEQYVRREHSAARGDDGIVQVHLVEPADMPRADRFDPDSGERAVLDDLGRRQRLRGDCVLAPWWREGPAVLAEVLDAMERSEAVKAAPRDLGADRRTLAERLRVLDLHLAWRLDRITLADLAPGNVARSHSHFVGRHHELRTLHDVMMTGAAGGRIGGRSVIAAAHGLGGLGKTALARQYAYAYADHYASGGMWELPCEGVEHLGRVLLRLAEDERFRQLGAEVGLPFVLSEAVRSDDDLALGAVLAQLQRVAERRVEHLLATLREHPERHTPASAEADAALRARLAPRVLLILDNVDQPALLSAEALARLPQAPWLELLITTRRDPQTDLGGGGDWHAAIEVGVLPADDALVLMREYQPGQRFRTTDDDDAARQIVERLGGYTLAVELVAAYLGQKARLGFGPADYLRRLDAAGPTDVDRLGRDAGTAQQIRHGEKQVRQVIAWSIDRLSPAARTALAFASRLMPDEIPLDWLQALTAARLPDVLEEHDGLPSPWAEVWAELHGLRLLHPADGEDDEGDGRTLPRMVRIHRMVAATLCEQTAADEDHLKAWIESFMEKLGTVFEQQVGQSQDNALRRLHPTLRDQTTYLIKKYPTAVLLRQAGAAANFEGEHGTIRLAIEITEKVVAGFDALLRAKPDSAQAARDVSVSLERLADFLRARGQAGDA